MAAADASIAAGSTDDARGDDSSRRRKEIYTYDAPWPLYSVACSQKPGTEYEFRFAVGSFVEEYCNKVQIVQLDDAKGEFVVRGTFDHPYPTTKVLWAPERLAKDRDLLATCGDYLRLWSVNPDGDVRSEALLNSVKTNEYCAPLTSFDWNAIDHSLVGTASIDTTCSIWDLEVMKIRTQLIAHDKEVYDLAWTRHKDIFATVGNDGSLRMFDLRSLEHSTIMYESPKSVPLLRLAWSRLDNNYVATFTQDSNKTVILDIRMPAMPVIELGGHVAPINGVTWAPHSACHICTAGDDFQALIWDLTPLPQAVEDPILAYTAESEVNSLVWSPSMPDWVTIAFSNKMQILRV